MIMEINSKANIPNSYSSPSRHHVRNLWPPVGGGLPGGKPVEPALGGSAQTLQKPPDYYGQSTSYVQNKPVAEPNDAANVDSNNYYYKSSQARQNSTAATNVVYPAAAVEYGNYYQQPKYFQRSVTADHWRPPSQTQQTSQFYHSDPTIMFNQVSKL